MPVAPWLHKPMSPTSSIPASSQCQRQRQCTVLLLALVQDVQRGRQPAMDMYTCSTLYSTCTHMYTIHYGGPKGTSQVANIFTTSWIFCAKSSIFCDVVNFFVRCREFLCALSWISLRRREFFLHQVLNFVSLSWRFARQVVNIFTTARTFLRLKFATCATKSWILVANILFAA